MVVNGFVVFVWFRNDDEWRWSFGWNESEEEGRLSMVLFVLLVGFKRLFLGQFRVFNLFFF